MRLPPSTCRRASAILISCALDIVPRQSILTPPRERRIRAEGPKGARELNERSVYPQRGKQGVGYGSDGHPFIAEVGTISFGLPDAERANGVHNG
jgi:hypothetical protein